MVYNKGRKRDFEKMRVGSKVELKYDFLICIETERRKEERYFYKET